MRKLVQVILRLAERIELSSGLERFLNVLFHFVSRKFSSKRSEHGFLENRGFFNYRC
jgi:hypothetical protein